MRTNRSLWAAASGLVVAAALVACTSDASIEGEWVEPVPGMENCMQGISLQAGGKASSVNMATLQYESWKREGSQLVLSGKSIGNGLTIPFSDTLLVEKLTQDSLILKKGTLVLRYSRSEGKQSGDTSAPSRSPSSGVKFQNKFKKEPS